MQSTACVRPAGTVVALGRVPSREAEALDPQQLSCEILNAGEDLFVRIKSCHPGTLLFLLLEETDDPALAAAAKAARILRRRGGGSPVLVFPPIPANPAFDARRRLVRAADLLGAAAVQPVGAASWIEAVRCFQEPLTVFGLVGVDAGEVHDLLRPGRIALVHPWGSRHLEQSLHFPAVRDVLLTCRLRPNARLREVDLVARALREVAPAHARLVITGPEVQDDGPAAIAAVCF